MSDPSSRDRPASPHEANVAAVAAVIIDRVTYVDTIQVLLSKPLSTAQLDILKAAATDEAAHGMAREGMEPLVKKMSEMVEIAKKTHDIGQATLTSMETIDKRLKRSMVQSNTYRRPQQEQV